MSCADLIPVCWSQAQRLRNVYRSALCHVQGEHGKTLCGIPYKVFWQYDAHDNVEAVSCLRCKRMLEKGAA